MGVWVTVIVVVAVVGWRVPDLINRWRGAFTLIQTHGNVVALDKRPREADLLTCLAIGLGVPVETLVRQRSSVH